MKKYIVLLILAPSLIYFFLAKPTQNNPRNIHDHKDVPPRTIEWADLMPDEDLKFLESQTPSDQTAATHASSKELSNAKELSKDINAQDHSLPPGTSSRFEKTLKDAIKEAKKPVSSPLKALIRSYTVRHDLNYTKIKVAGYIVPLEYNEQKTITSFFLVPYYGACIHVPPPPPNQIIYVRIPKGLKLTDINNPFWATGILKIETVTKDNGVSAYSLDAEKIEDYKE